MVARRAHDHAHCLTRLPTLPRAALPVRQQPARLAAATPLGRPRRRPRVRDAVVRHAPLVDADRIAIHRCVGHEARCSLWTQRRALGSQDRRRRERLASTDRQWRLVITPGDFPPPLFPDYTSGGATGAGSIPFPWIIAFILTPEAIWRIARRAERSTREFVIRRGRCPRCHYDRSGLSPASPCPECGEPLTADEQLLAASTAG